MPKTLYDEDGNEIQVPAEEEIKALEEKAAKVEEYEKQIQEKETELQKYQDKEFNFQKLRGKTQAEKDELLKEFNEREKKLIQEMETLHNKVDEFHSASMASYEDNILSAMAGEDHELRDKIKERAKDFVGSPKSKDDLFKRYKDAYTLIKGETPQVNPINQFSPSRTSSILSNEKKSFTETERGQKLYDKFFPNNSYKK